MFHHTLNESDFRKKYLFFWFLLSFSAGNINAGGFMATQRFVTHVTGFATLFGIDIAEGRWMQAVGILSVPLYFLLGSMISAFFVDRRQYLHQRPNYAIVMFLVCLCLLVASIGGHSNIFGIWGDTLELSQDYSLLALLCTSSGLMNGAITTSSRGTVRTTHLTGLTTDLGLGIVRVFYDRQEKPAHALEVRANWLRIGTIGSFVGGSVVGAVLFLQVNYLGFLLPASLAAFACYRAWKIEKLRHKKAS